MMTEADTAWALDLCRRKYSDRFDFETTANWYRNLVLKSPLVFWPVRASDSFLIAMIVVTPWLPADPECNVAMVVGKVWQCLDLARASIDWARRRKCTTWRITSETEFDLGALALRVGAKEQTPRYTLVL